MMKVISIVFTMAVFLFSGVSSELLRPPQPPQHNYAFNKYRPTPSEPTFIQSLTSWFFPWGGISSEEEFRVPASSKIDLPPLPIPPTRPPPHQNSPIARMNPPYVRDTEPTTARTTQASTVTKCSPCNKVPWIPMMPTYQLPLVNSPGGQHHQVYFKHHFDNENQYAQVPGGYKYGPPVSTLPPITTPIKFQEDTTINQGHQYYGVPPIKNVQFQGYPMHSSGFSKATTNKPNSSGVTIDTSVITFTTGRPQNNRPSRFTAAGSVTNPEYILPPNILPLEGEHSQIAPIPIPNLSPTPIPPLFDSKNFHHDPYRSQKTGFIRLVPLEPVAQLSNNVNVQVKPKSGLQEFAAIKKKSAVEVITSNLVAEFTIPGTVHDDSPSRPHTDFSSQHIGFNLDVGNNLDLNTTINSPIVVESLETATDNVVAGSEHDYEHNVHQALELPLNQVEASDDDTINLEESNRVVSLPDYEQNYHLDEITTTEQNYVVKFEPSIQTAADLAEKDSRENKSGNSYKESERLTPLELLDSPIFHVTPFTTKPKLSVASGTRPPPFKPLDDFTKKLATLWTSPIPISTSTEQTTTPNYKAAQTTSTETTPLQTHTTTLSFLSKLSGITPPREPAAPAKPSLSTKKPKQIQIVIPYKTYHKPSPFKVQEELQEILTYRPLIRGHYVTHPTRRTEKSEIKSLKVDEKFSGHGYHNDQEYPDHAQESKIVESKVTIEPPRTTKYLTKILANNIRDLLKKEKLPKPPKIDLIRLQKNIDGWTEQSFLGKASTISLTGHTKTIPRSFLSTTMKTTTMMQLPTTTLSPKKTFDTDLMEETKRQYDNILYKKEDDLLYVKRHDRFLDRNNELVLINNNLTYNLHQEGVKVELNEDFIKIYTCLKL